MVKAGSINPVEQVVEWSKKYGTKVLVDACQSVPHMPVDVQALGVDFLVASSHKVNKKSLHLRMLLDLSSCIFAQGHAFRFPQLSKN